MQLGWLPSGGQDSWRHARNRGVVRRLETVYYDTPERALFQRGMSLRVRRSGKHFIQTLKLLPDIGRPLARRQWETPVDGITPDLARLPADEIGDPVTTLAHDALVPAFATKVRRHAVAGQQALQPDDPGAPDGRARDQIAVAKTLRKRWRRFKATPAFWGR